MSPQKQSSPAYISLPGIGTDLGHMTEVVVFELLPGIRAAQDAAALSIAVNIGCCFVPHSLMPFDLAPM